MEKEYKICCVTGHRPKSFPWKHKGDPANHYTNEYQNIMKELLIAAIEEGFNYFISGGALGVDMDFAETVLFLRDYQYPDIKLEIAVPCLEQDKFWNEVDKTRYKDIIELADRVVLISKKATVESFYKRNEYMVDKAQLVFVFWNEKEKGGTYYTYQYAKSTHKSIRLISLVRLMDRVKQLEKDVKKLKRKENVSLEQSDSEDAKKSFDAFLQKMHEYQERREAKRKTNVIFEEK